MADVIDISCCKILRATRNEKKRWNRSSLKKKKNDRLSCHSGLYCRPSSHLCQRFTRKLIQFSRQQEYSSIALDLFLISCYIKSWLDWLFFYVGSKARLHLLLFLLNAESRRTEEWTSRHPLQHTAACIENKKERLTFLPPFSFFFENGCGRKRTCW